MLCRSHDAGIVRNYLYKNNNVTVEAYNVTVMQIVDVSRFRHLFDSCSESSCAFCLRILAHQMLLLLFRPPTVCKPD